MRKTALLAALGAVLSACAPGQRRDEPAPASTTTVRGPLMRLLPPSEYPDFRESLADKAGLAKAGRKTIAYLEKLPGNKFLRLGEREYGPAQLIDSIQELIAVAEASATPEAFDAAVRERFDVFQSVGSDGQGKVVFSSYYQPVLRASLKKSDKFPFPLYSKPADLVEADLGAFDKKWAGEKLIGRVTKDNKLVPYHTRGDIDLRKALAGKGLEIAWLNDRFDVLDLHIQGSGILRLPDGTERLVKYAGNNGQTYNAVGLFLVRANVFQKDEITRDKLRDYIRAHSEVADWIIAQNPRFIFFDVVPLPEDGEPFGTVDQSLVPSRSIAVDPAVIPLGSIAFFTVTSPQADAQGRLLGAFPAPRFALCMDTGGAIKGPGRVDIYVGHGEQAAATARHQWHEGRLYVLVKKVPARQR